MLVAPLVALSLGGCGAAGPRPDATSTPRATGATATAGTVDGPAATTPVGSVATAESGTTLAVLAATSDGSATAPAPTTAPAPSTSAPPATVPATPTVAVIGDSLTFTSGEQQRLQLLAAGWDPVVIDGHVGETISDRVAAIRQALAAHHPTALVIALGTNDARMIAESRRPPAEQWAITRATAFTALADAEGVPCVVWVGINAHTDRFFLSTFGPEFNAFVQRYAVFADWSARSVGHPEWFLLDEVHLSAEGDRQYAALIAETVRTRCAAPRQ